VALDLDLHIQLKMVKDCYSISLETFTVTANTIKDSQSSLVSNNLVATSSSHAPALATPPLHHLPQLPSHSPAIHKSTSSD
jgi:hypothetical protein